jgi:hypothetical protein
MLSYPEVADFSLRIIENQKELTILAFLTIPHPKFVCQDSSKHCIRTEKEIDKDSSLDIAI